MENIDTKISLVGLANAGKTSLIRTLKRTYNIGESLAPTKNVERTKFYLWGSEGSLWDFGGQEQYRRSYLRDPSRYFTDTDFLFYVIDIQDKHKYPEAVKYFEDVFNAVKVHSGSLICVVLFHKCDPGLEETNFEEDRNNLQQEILKIALDTDIFFETTSIYDPTSALEAFSKPILGSRLIYSEISVLFSTFSMNHNIEYCSLIVDDLLELGSFKLRGKNDEFIESSVEFYQQFASIENKNEEEYELEKYKFLIKRTSHEGYNYSLNLAYRIKSENNPTQQEISKVIDEINHLFDKYTPKLI